MYRTNKPTAVLMLSGAIVILFALTIFPLLFSFILSFHTWSLTKPGPWVFVGLRNYWELLRDEVFWKVISTTLLFTFSVVTIEFLLGLGLAHLFNKEFKGEAVVRSALIMPMMVPPVLIGLLWLFMYKKDFGIINYLLQLLSIDPVSWLSKPGNSFFAIMLADIWQWTPFMFIILLAGLRSIPVEVYESALIDGSTSWQTFRFLTFPLIQPMIAIALLFRFMDAFRTFDKIFQLTGGGPGVATETMSLFIYRNGFRYFNMGYASALSYVALIIIIIFSTFFLKILRRTQVVT